MLSSERHQLILSELESKGHVSVIELKHLLQVSTDTVRRDLAHLERLDKLQRIHGGAVSKDAVATNQAFMKRNITFIERKQELAGYAVQFVKENQAICLNAGTTNIEVAKQLAAKFDRLTIITNSLKIADLLTVKREFTVIVPGGFLNHEEYSLYGRSIGEEIARFNIDVAFISINAISLEKGLTDFRQGESEVINAMIRNAGKTIVVADSSKFQTVSYLNICGFDQIHAIVTDTHLDKDMLDMYKSNRIDIVNSFVEP